MCCLRISLVKQCTVLIIFLIFSSTCIRPQYFLRPHKYSWSRLNMSVEQFTLWLHLLCKCWSPRHMVQSLLFAMCLLQCLHCTDDAETEAALSGAVYYENKQTNKQTMQLTYTSSIDDHINCQYLSRQQDDPVVDECQSCPG